MLNCVTYLCEMKQQQYANIHLQVKSLIEDESDLVANLGNVAALLKSSFHFWWVGFYLVKDDVLVLGPFQGPVACTRIALGKGVCGNAWQQKSSILVPNVHEFEGHIACSSESNSELVIPIIKDNKVVAVLDIDSVELNHFDEMDQLEMEKLCQQLSRLF